MSAVEEKVKEIITKQMGAKAEQITKETSFINDLGADSLDTVELIMEFEDAFDMNIPMKKQKRSVRWETPLNT